MLKWHKGILVSHQRRHYTQIKVDVLEFTDQLVTNACMVMKHCVHLCGCILFILKMLQCDRSHTLLSLGILSVSWGLVTPPFAFSVQDAVFKSSCSGNRRGTGQEQQRPQKETEQSLTQ